MSDNIFKALSHSVIAFVVFLSILVLPTKSFCANEKVRVGVYDNPPKVFTTPDGFTAGLYPEILQEIAKERGWSIQYVTGTWQECLDRLEAKQIDIVVDIAKTQERETLFDFTSEPVLTNWGSVYARKQFPIASFQDLKDKSIAVVKGSVHTDGPHGIRYLMKLFEIPCRFVVADSYRHALMLLDAGQVDASVVNRLFGTLYANEYEVAATPIIFSPLVLLFAGQKDTARSNRLRNQIDDSLRSMKEDPDSIYHKAMAYYLSGGRNKWTRMQKRHLEDLNLSRAETEWLKKHPVIRIGIDTNFAPFEFLSDNGDFNGIAADYLELLTQKTGLKFKRVAFDSWQETVNAVENHNIDVLPCVGVTKEREKFLSFTDPYIRFSRVVITNIDSAVERDAGLSAVNNLRVGVQQNSSHHAFLRENSDIKPKLYDTFQNAILDLSNGKIEAVVGNMAVATHVMKNLSLTNLKFATYADPEPQSLSAGVRKDWPELKSIMNRALKLVTYRERTAILSKWFPLSREAHGNIGLTREEREWLLMYPSIRVAWDREWAPIEFADPQGKARGISIDYLSAIEEMLGIQFDMGQDIGWQAVSRKVEKREMDMFSCVSITAERLKHLDFTDTYLTIPVVIFGHNSASYVRSLSELQGKKLAVIDGYATDAWVSHDFPGFDLTRSSTIQEAFKLLQQKKIDAFVCSILPGNYYLSHLRSHNIKIIGETPYTHKLRMAVRKDWPLFTRILQKALNALPKAEKTYFYRKWARVKYEKGFDYALFKKIMIIIFAVIAIMVLWNRHMASEIARRKKVEAKLSQSQSALQANNIELKEMEALKDNLTHMIVHDMRSPLMGISGMLELLSDDLKTLQPSSSIRLNLLSACSGVETLNRMVQSLLDVFKLESNELHLACEKLDLNNIADIAIKGMQAQARMHDQKILLSGKSSVGEFDPEIIRRVLTNLIENALKVSLKGGVVEVCTNDDGLNIIAEVRDYGRGIPQELQKNIFDKFVSVEKGKANKVSSYGLGLAFCRLAVEAHKGRIQVESAQGSGSVFRIILPK